MLISSLFLVHNLSIECFLVQVLDFCTAWIAYLLSRGIALGQLQLHWAARTAYWSTAPPAVGALLLVFEGQHRQDWEGGAAQVAEFGVLIGHVRVIEFIRKVLDVEVFVNIGNIERRDLGHQIGTIIWFFANWTDIRSIRINHRPCSCTLPLLPLTWESLFDLFARRW